jgi:hypothetical protein
MTASSFSELWVCFTPPPAAPASDVLVLSFLPPGLEENASAAWGDQLVRGRDALQDVRPAARRAYLDLVARIGATPCRRGRTLRQALRGSDGVSRWWFLKLSEKNCIWDDDQTYSTLLRLFTVRAVAEKHAITRALVHGGPRAFGEALGVARPKRARDAVAALVAVAGGLVGRLLLAVRSLYRWTIYRSLRWQSPGACDVLLEAHWDWSLGPDAAGGLRERYFADVPTRLRAHGQRVAWLASCEPAAVVWQRGRAFRSVAASACSQRDVVILDRYLTVTDVLATTLNVRDPLIVTGFMRSRAFRALFVVDDLDMYPVMRDRLLRDAWGTSICRWEQVAIGTRRACLELRPRVLLTFLELFLHAKALYVGARAGAPGIVTWAAQHAAYCSDKTFGTIDPRVEGAGEPDGCPSPVPDGVFVMGELARRLWRENGFDDQHIVLTGGLRYQHVTLGDVVGRSVAGEVRILLVGGTNTEVDIDMCDALATAVRGLAGVRLRLRDHPHYCLTEKREFDRFRGLIEITQGTAHDALAEADLVVFGHSSLADEALMRGIPVWQWLWPGFNTSVFVDLPLVPAFGSVATLRAALQRFVADPAAHRPSRDTRADVARQCFGPEPSRAAERVADVVATLSRRGAVPS